MPRHKVMKKEKLDFKALKKIFGYAKKYFPLMIISIICATVGAVTTIIGPDKISSLMNILLDGIFTGVDMKAFLEIAIPNKSTKKRGNAPFAARYTKNRKAAQGSAFRKRGQSSLLKKRGVQKSGRKSLGAVKRARKPCRRSARRKKRAGKRTKVYCRGESVHLQGSAFEKFVPLYSPVKPKPPRAAPHQPPHINRPIKPLLKPSTHRPPAPAPFPVAL